MAQPVAESLAMVPMTPLSPVSDAPSISPAPSNGIGAGVDVADGSTSSDPSGAVGGEGGQPAAVPQTLGVIGPARPDPCVSGDKDACRALPAGVFDGLLGRAVSKVDGTMGVSVVDAVTGETLLDRSSDKALMPASSLKITTALTTLAKLKPGTRFTTETRIDAGTLFLVGGGDPELCTDPSPSVNPLYRSCTPIAVLADRTAFALKQRQVTSVTLAWDGSLFTGPDWHPQWPDTYISEVVPVQALVLDHGTTSQGVTRQPGLAAVTEFAALLAQRGIKAQLGPDQGKKAPETAQPLASVDSSPVEEILYRAMLRSDNLVMEALGRHAALAAGREGSFDGATATILEEIKGLGADDGTVISDCSGLSRENRLSARTLTTLLAKAGGDHRLREVFSQLPVAKATGSLKTRFDIEEGVPGIGRVRAKTGVLTGARALAGIATTANGHPVIFATLINESTDDWVAGEWVIEVSALLAAAGTPR